MLLQATTNPGPPVSNWAILAAIAAIISAISAFKSSRIAKKALKLAGQNYQDRQSNFALYLIDGFRWTSEENRKFLLFHISIINKSDSKSSFKSELEIEYIRTDQLVARAIVPHDEQLNKLILPKSLSVFSNDIRVEEKGMQSKWLIFEQPKNVFKEFRIEKYSIQITDTQGRTESAQSFILKELNNGDKKN